MDMMTYSSTQRMQLSADPEDWCWVRWYKAKADAKSMPQPHFGALGLWEDHKTDIRVGPQIHMEGSQWRPSVVSPFPGLKPHGELAWYRDGLPLDVRVEAPAREMCGGELWDSEIAVDVQIESEEEEDDVVTGTILPYAGMEPPIGYLACDGAEVSRETYAALFAVIGTTYGAGDGETTFALPDLRGKFPTGTGGPVGASQIGQTGCGPIMCCGEL